MAEPLRRPAGMSFEEFIAFAVETPDDERWELIDGVPVMAASPTDLHQVIIGNIITALVTFRRRNRAPWIALPGVTMRIPAMNHRAPLPDVLVRRAPVIGLPFSEEALVLFEVLSPRNTPRDREWRLGTYQNAQGAEHYVVIRQDRPEATRYDRDADWRPTPVEGIGQALELPALGTSIAMADIYEATRFEAETGS
jgi:Uma2 family endonuclease